ncbi:MAG: DUF4390 domain-containing protein [Burkholderiales bacterium]|nr:DUF4390 domain-containing protein [Burkholderiales bacterium]
MARTSLWLRSLCWCVWSVCAVFAASIPGHAQTPPVSQVEVSELRLERSEGALLLQSTLRLDLSHAVEEALQKGMPLYFVTEAELVRDRWYWYDKKINTIARHYRLAYQPLTRMWRLNVSREPIGAVGLASSLSQTFETLPEALAAIRRTVNWKLTDVSELGSDNKYTLIFKFRLDVSQLPRPFQMMAGSQSEWNLSTQKTLRFSSEVGR